jgi:hypothetical protein
LLLGDPDADIFEGFVVSVEEAEINRFNLGRVLKGRFGI